MSGVSASLYDVIVDNNGNIYISLYDGQNKIKKYSPAGVYLNEYIPESGLAAMCYKDNFIYITNSAGVFKLDLNFNVVKSCNSVYGGDFWHEIGESIAVSDTSVIVSYTNMTYQKYIARLSTDLVFEGAASGYDLGCIRCYNNNFYSTIDQNLIKISSNFLPEAFEHETIGGLSMGVGSYFSISSGFLYTPYGDAVLKYSISDGSYIGSFLESGSGDGQLSSPAGIFIKE